MYSFNSRLLTMNENHSQSQLLCVVPYLQFIYVYILHRSINKINQNNSISVIKIYMSREFVYVFVYFIWDKMSFLNWSFTCEMTCFHAHIIVMPLEFSALTNQAVGYTHRERETVSEYMTAAVRRWHKPPFDANFVFVW